jgi:hypothetical protein
MKVGEILRLPSIQAEQKPRYCPAQAAEHHTHPEDKKPNHPHRAACVLICFLHHTAIHLTATFLPISIGIPLPDGKPHLRADIGSTSTGTPARIQARAASLPAQSTIRKRSHSPPTGRIYIMSPILLQSSTAAKPSTPCIGIGSGAWGVVGSCPQACRLEITCSNTPGSYWLAHPDMAMIMTSGRVTIAPRSPIDKARAARHSLARNTPAACSLAGLGVWKRLETRQTTWSHGDHATLR